MQRFQWVANIDQVLAIVGHTPRAGERKYFAGTDIRTEQTWAVAKLRGPGAGSGYEIDDMQAFLITHTQVRTFLTNRGETLPTETFMYIRESVPGSEVYDELVLVEDALPGAL